VIAPLSTLGHWQRELQGWTGLNTIVYHGNKEARQAIYNHEWYFDHAVGDRRSNSGVGGSVRAAALLTFQMFDLLFEQGGGRKGGVLHKVNVVLTTYEMINLPAAPGEPHLAGEHWPAIVIDEAHRLKNADSKLTRELEQFRFDHVVLLTGTPLQNNPGELFTLIHFIQPVEFPVRERAVELGTCVSPRPTALLMFRARSSVFDPP
jgi:SNF2 family DNA or RNA helicase